MLVPTAEQARDTASSPSGCAMHCIAIGATRMGMLKCLPAHQIAARTLGSGSLPKSGSPTGWFSHCQDGTHSMQDCFICRS